uniref:Putative clathrin assembly protein At4g40080 n=1 Tax=Anthurium amnicola TaxID=1678845 RepID=A0A1D1Y614_9ARAE
MGLESKKKLRGIVGTIKDKASLLTSAASPSPAAAVVVRATTHHPASAPAPQRHLDALLAFGLGSRPTAASAVSALLSRLRATRDAAVALKCLASLHHLARRGSFILRDQLFSSLLLPPAGGTPNPLNLSAFHDPSTPDSWALSACVRWYARLLEHLLSCYRATGTFLNQRNGDPPRPGEAEERAASLPNEDLLRELDALVGLLEETRRAPDPSGSGLVEEVVSWVEEDRAAAEEEALARVREVGQRLACIGFADSVELICLLRKLEEYRGGAPPSGGRKGMAEGLWEVVGEVRVKVEAAMAVAEVEQRRAGQVRKERVSESARLGDRALLLSSGKPLRFGSTRWSDR